MGRGMRWGVVALATAVAAGWLYRERIGVLVAPPASAAHLAARPDVLYSWVDPDGVTHYEQDSGQGQRLQYDGSRITPVAPVDTGLAARIRQVAGVGPGAQEGGASGGDAAGAAPRGSQTLHQLRQDMEENARKMQAARAAQRGL